LLHLHVTESPDQPGKATGLFTPTGAEQVYVLQEMMRAHDPALWDTYRSVPLAFIVHWKNQHKLFRGRDWIQRRRAMLDLVRYHDGTLRPDADIQVVRYVDPHHITREACLMIDWESLAAYPELPLQPGWDWYDPHYIAVSTGLAQAVFEQHGEAAGARGRRVASLYVSEGDCYESVGECKRLQAYDEHGAWCGALIYEPWRRGVRTRYLGGIYVGLHPGLAWWAESHWR